jgi:hypothetical protein
VSEIDHANIKRFAADRVNLPADKAAVHRQQVNALRERLKHKIAEEPSFDLVKLLHAGSVAKGPRRLSRLRPPPWTLRRPQ